MSNYIWSVLWQEGSPPKARRNEFGNREQEAREFRDFILARQKELADGGSEWAARCAKAELHRCEIVWKAVS